MESADESSPAQEPHQEGYEADEPPITFSNHAFSYTSPKLALRRNRYGIAQHAKEKILKDEVLIGWSGRVVHVKEVLAMPESERTYILQIDEELFQVPFWAGYNEPADFTNHCCEPNAGFGNSPVTLVAMRDIMPGEEIRFDYAMSECVENLPGNCDWDCLCGSDKCRGKFRGTDWKLPELWERYGNYFSPYLRKKIVQLKAQQTGGVLDFKSQEMLKSVDPLAGPAAAAVCSVPAL